MSLDQKNTLATAEKTNAPTTDVDNIPDAKEQAAYWREIPKYLALRHLGKYAVFLRNEEDCTLALERARTRLGWVAREKIITAPPFSADIERNNTKATGIFTAFFQKLGSKNALAESQLAAHHLSRHYPPDRLEQGDRVEIKNGYFYLWDRAGRLVSNYPFVQVYSADQSFDSAKNSIGADDSRPKTDVEAETATAKPTAAKAEKTSPPAANPAPLDLLSDNLIPAKTVKTAKPSPQPPTANVPTVRLNELLPDQASVTPEKLLQAARRDREKIWKTIHGSTLRPVLTALKNSDYKVTIAFRKNDADNDPRIETAFSGVIMGQKYKNRRAMVHRFSGNGQMETAVFDRMGIKKRERTDDIRMITANPKSFLIKTLNETYDQLPGVYRWGSLGGVRRVFDQLINIINEN